MTTIELTQNEIDQIISELHKISEQQQKEALANKPSFLKWLRNRGMELIANKLMDWVWSKIKGLFGW